MGEQDSICAGAAQGRMGQHLQLCTDAARHQADKISSEAGCYLLGGVGVGVLHKGLEALALLKGGNLLHQAERAEDQVQRVERDRQIRLRQKHAAHQGYSDPPAATSTQGALSRHHDHACSHHPASS